MLRGACATMLSLASLPSQPGSPQPNRSSPFPHMLTVPGDGIGPEVANSVKHIYDQANVPIKWEEGEYSQGYSLRPRRP